MVTVAEGGTDRTSGVTPLVLETDPDLAKLQLKNQEESSILKASGMMQNGDYAGAIDELTATLSTFPQSARGEIYQPLLAAFPYSYEPFRYIFWSSLASERY